MRQQERAYLEAVDARQRRFRLDITAALALAGVAFYHGTDYFLIKNGHRPYTDLIRDNWPVFAIGVTVIGLHVARKLGRFDPYLKLGQLFGLSPA